MSLPTKDDVERRQSWAVGLVDSLDRPMSVLGVLFLFVVIGQAVATSPALATTLSALSWLLWLVFAGEYLLRLYAAPRRIDFVRRTWWQLAFLIVPFLRFLRLARIGRIARFGRLFSSTIRSGRSAGRLLSSRLAWLATLSAIVALAAGQLLYSYSEYSGYGEALHDSALATITGEPLSADGAVARVTEVVLAVYSVVVFATLAASLGAFFLGQDGRSPAPGLAEQERR